MIERKTTFSADRVYRYTLWREWDFKAVHKSELALGFDGFKKLRMSDDYVQFIGLNPSTADETKDDPTIRRCVGFAKAWGFGALCMTNLFALRATDPAIMKSSALPIGMDNAKWIVSIGKEAGMVVAAWGNDGSFNKQDVLIRGILNAEGIALHHLGLTAAKQPKHPLYLKKTTEPEKFQI